MAKAHLVVNLMNGFEERDHELMTKLGAYSTGVSKLDIKRLADIDLGIYEATTVYGFWAVGPRR